MNLRLRTAATVLALLSLLTGCAQYYERKQNESRAKFLMEHPDTDGRVAEGIRMGAPVDGMTVAQLEAALAVDIFLVSSSSDGSEVYRWSRGAMYPYTVGTETLYFFEQGRLTYWSTSY